MQVLALLVGIFLVSLLNWLLVLVELLDLLGHLCRNMNARAVGGVAADAYSVVSLTIEPDLLVWLGAREL